MSKPVRTVDSRRATDRPRTVFVTTRTAGSRNLFQTEQMANLFIDTLRADVRAKRFTIQALVVMPNHVHLLLTLPGNVTVEKSMQFIKGGFSYRAAKELSFRGEIWQRGFSHEFVSDRVSFERHRKYIDNNPVKAGLANSPEEYRYGSAYLMKQKQAGAKAPDVLEYVSGTTEVVP